MTELKGLKVPSRRGEVPSGDRRQGEKEEEEAEITIHGKGTAVRPGGFRGRAGWSQSQEPGKRRVYWFSTGGVRQ